MLPKKTLLITLLANIILLQSLISCDEFSHLLSEISENKRVHIISEHFRLNKRLQIDEFLDLQTCNQFIQFRWHEDNDDLGPSKKLSYIIINELRENETKNQKLIWQYESYECKLNSYNLKNDHSNWEKALQSSLAIKSRSYEAYVETIRTIMSTSDNSPYLALIDDGNKWVFGIAGLWLKAQYPGDKESRVAKSSNSNLNPSSSWELKLPRSNLNIRYYFNDLLLNHRKQAAGSRSSLLNMVELRETGNSHVFDSINIIDVDFKFSDKLASNLFKLPIGFNCPTNPRLDELKEKLYFNDFNEAQKMSKMINFEVMATRFSGSKTNGFYSESEIKTITMASSKHPLNSDLPLIMFGIVEDRCVYIRDFYHKLRYKMKFDSEHHHCEINKLHTYDFKQQQAIDLIELNFNNAIMLHLNENILDYLLDHPNKPSEWSYLNQFETTNEHVFETEVAEAFDHLLTIYEASQSGVPRVMAKKMNLIRVYRKKSESSKLIHLVRLILIVYDYNRHEKLAELRFNLIESMQPLSFANKAKLFDLTKCYNRSAAEQLELVISYPIEDEEDLIDFSSKRSHELMEAFYKSSLDYRDFQDKRDTLTESEKEKRRIVMSMNYLRIPRIEFQQADNGELELHLTILDKPAPMNLFEKLTESTFQIDQNTLDPVEESLLAKSLEECSYFCQLFKCNMFSYDYLLKECKLSPLTIDDNSMDELDEIDDDEIRDQLISPVSVIKKREATLFYRVGMTDGQKMAAIDFDEVSLTELKSYLEHTMNDLGKIGNESTLSRSTRNIKVQELPLFSIKVKASSKNEFAPAQTQFLIPSKVRPRIPLILDVSNQARQVKLEKSFKTIQTEKRYELSAMDDFEEIPKELILADERTFMNNDRSVYFTLRRLHNIELDLCSMLCYNIDQFDTKTNGEQVCQSYSYCQLEKQCVLAIKTDASYTKSILDVGNIKEGDYVLTITTPEVELLRDSLNCIVTKRNYLSGFEGPLKLPKNVFAKSSTSSDQFFRETEWLDSFKRDSDVLLHDARDECAEKCLSMNKLGRYKCLAIDYCRFKIPAHILANGVHVKARNGLSCHLFIIESGKVDGRNDHTNIGKLRNRLTRVVESAEKVNKKDVDEQHCSRYLMSHSNEFSHIKQSKLDENFKQAQLGMASNEPEATMNVNYDTCAFECANQEKCLLFEFCSSFNQKTGKYTRSCMMFGVQVKLEANKNSDTTTSIQPATVYSSDCHVYLRSRQFKTVWEVIEDARNHPLAGKPMQAWHHSYLPMILIFMVLYALIGGLIYLYVSKSQPAKLPPTTGDVSQRQRQQQQDLNNLELQKLSRMEGGSKWQDIKI